MGTKRGLQEKMGKKLTKDTNKQKSLDWDLTRGHWTSILSSAGISPLYLTKKGTPCPLCGGTDRFMYDDKNGTGSSFCRKCPEHGNPDAKNGLELYCLYKNVNKAEAIKEITDFLGLSNFDTGELKQKAQVIEEKQYLKKISYPAPNYDLNGNDQISIYSETKKVNILYKNISYWYDWFDSSHNRVGYLARLANKTTLQILHGELEDEDGGSYVGWFQGTYGKNRPPALFSSKGEKGLIVEGEKCASFAAEKLANYSVITWTGGANAAHLTDFSQLPNIPWYIYPDNNEVGVKAATVIENSLREQGYDVSILSPDYPYPDADIIDIPGVKDYDQYIDNLIGKSKRKEEDHQTAEDFFFTNVLVPLGFNRTEFYFIKKIKDQRGQEIKQVLTLTPSTMTTNGLLALACFDQWFQLAPGEKGPEWSVIKDKLIRKCEAKGLISTSDFRRYGFWRDGEDIVFNEGSRVYLNGKLASECVNGAIYETENPKLSANFNWNLQFTKEDYGLIQEAFRLVSFSSEDERQACIAWCLTALGCGMWKSRPHLKVIGPSGVGKSTLLQIMRAIWGGFCERLAGNETEAGVRIKLNNQALPVTFDEAEVEERNSLALEGIEGLKRLAFKPGEEQVRGTSDQKLKSFKVNFMLAEMAVGAKEQKETNINRQILCHLTMEDRIAGHDVKVEDVIQRIIESNIKEKLIATLYRKRPEIENGLKALRAEIPAEFNGRLTETLGLCLVTNQILQGKEMKSSEILQNYLWKKTKEQAEENSHPAQILETLMATTIPNISKRTPGFKMPVRNLITGYIFNFAIRAGLDVLDLDYESRTSKSDWVNYLDLHFEHELYKHGLLLVVEPKLLPPKRKDMILEKLVSALGLVVFNSKSLTALNPTLKNIRYEQVLRSFMVKAQSPMRKIESWDIYSSQHPEIDNKFIPLSFLRLTEYEIRNAI